MRIIMEIGGDTKMKQERNQIMLRLPTDLHTKLNGMSQKLGDSKNACILMILNKAV